MLAFALARRDGWKKHATHTHPETAGWRAGDRTDGTALVDGFPDDIHNTSQGRATDGNLRLGGEGAWDRVCVLVSFCRGSIARGDGTPQRETGSANLHVP
mgnify:CR=1 FL=1|jgi:hypothetical protein